MPRADKSADEKKGERSYWQSQTWTYSSRPFSSADKGKIEYGILIIKQLKIHQTMTEIFKKYESISNLTLAHREYFNGNPIVSVTEKVHGANFSIVVCMLSGDCPTPHGKYTHDFGSGPVEIGLYACKRNHIIAFGENFFGYESVFESHAHLAFKLFIDLVLAGQLDPYKCIGSARGMSVFGELYGGGYTGIVSKTKPIQCEVLYAPTVKFMGLDIFVPGVGYLDDNVTREHFRRLGIQETLELARLPLSMLFKFLDSTDSFGDSITSLSNDAEYVPESMLLPVVDFRQEYVTIVPGLFGLNPLPDNYAEGIVFKTVHETSVKRLGRAIIKIKSGKFVEKHMGAGPKSSVCTRTADEQREAAEAFTFITEFASSAVNNARIQSAISKIGPYSSSTHKEIMTTAIRDVMSDIKGTHPDKFKYLSAAERIMLSKQIYKDVSEVVQEFNTD